MFREENLRQSETYTVSGLTAELKLLLENRYSFVRIRGEISNLGRPPSGHIYFTLKDPHSQISAVVFRNIAGRLKFRLENGMEITGIARLNLYEPRGTYQLVFEVVEPEGTGALQKAFEQLKKLLAEEGLFDEKFKKKLPFLPDKISIITSPSGAVIHDIITVTRRRFSSVALEIVPVKVQGDQSEAEIKEAIALLNKRADTDIIIIARGGGSLEDLASFNSETVARAVFSSEIPVVSAVGHETDYTICDFVSDMRAPTPSAAAELVVPERKKLLDQVEYLESSLTGSITAFLEQRKRHLKQLTEKLVDPRRRIIDFRIKIDDSAHRLTLAMNNRLSLKRSDLSWKTEKLFLFDPGKLNKELKNRLNRLDEDLVKQIISVVQTKKNRLIHALAKIEALNPFAILERGYSVTRSIPGGKIVTDAGSVKENQSIEIILARGSINASVKGIIKNGEKKF